MRLAAQLASTVLADDANRALLPADGAPRLAALHSRFGRAPPSGSADAEPDGNPGHGRRNPSAIADGEGSLDREWLDQTAAHTGRLLPEALRIAARHDARAVRSSVGEAVRRLLGECRRTLPSQAAVHLMTTLAALRADADAQVQRLGPSACTVGSRRSIPVAAQVRAAATLPAGADGEWRAVVDEALAAAVTALAPTLRSSQHSGVKVQAERRLRSRPRAPARPRVRTYTQRNATQRALVCSPTALGGSVWCAGSSSCCPRATASPTACWRGWSTGCCMRACLTARTSR